VPRTSGEGSGGEHGKTASMLNVVLSFYYFLENIAQESRAEIMVWYFR